MEQDDKSDQLEKIIQRSDKEIDRVYKVYRILGGALGVILAAGIATFGYVSYNSVKDMRNDMREEMRTIRASVDKEMGDIKQNTFEESKVLSNRLKAELEMIVSDVGKKVNKRIDEEFKTENIQSLVKSNAQQRIDKVADQIIEDKIEKKVKPVLDAANQSLKSIDADAAKIHEELTKVTKLTDFTMTNIMAQNDNKVAFERLQKCAEDKSCPMSVEARQALDAIIDRHTTNFLVLQGPPIPWGEGVDPAKLSIAELEAKYESFASPRTRSDIAYYIANRSDIAKKDRLQFLVKELKSEVSLKAVDQLLTLFSKLSGQTFKPFDTDSVLEWWNRNKNIIK